MRSRSIFLAVIGVLISLSVNQRVDAYPPNPTASKIEGWCNEHGGHFWRASNGVYGCSLPDGTVVVCGGGLPGCDEITPAELRRLRQTDHPPIGAILALEEQAIRNLRHLGASMDNLQTKMGEVQTVCGPPDLVPLSQPGSVPPNYCQIDAQGNLSVRVKNQGLSDAGVSTLRVTFGTSGGPVVADVPTPVLPGNGAFADLSIPIPAACSEPFPTICKFVIAVDIAGVVLENDESNNNVEGACVPVG